MADEGGSSSSSDPNTSSQHALARDVNQLVEQIAANTKNTPLFGQLIPKALDYIKSDEAGAKKQHILCSRGDREPEWQLHACMIRVLSFKTGPEIEEWLAILAKALYSCADCFKGYLKAKMMLQKTYLAGFPEAAIERFLTHVDEWEENIALDLFERRKVAPGGGLGFLSTAELYAVLSAVAVREKIRQRVKDTMTLHKLSSTMPEIPAGLLRLATEPDEKSRKWAAMQLEGRKAEAMGMSEGLPTTRPVQKVVMDLAKQLADGTQSDERLDQLWSATSLIYQCAPTALGPLAPNILPNLQDTTTRLPHLLRAFDGILRSRGASLWQEVDEKDSEYPLVLLSSILDNAAFLKEVGSVTTAAAMQPYTAWMTSLLASLSSPSSPDQDSSSSEPYKSANGLNGASGSTSTLRRQDTPPPSSSRTASPSNLYNEVLKRLTNFLLERMQQGLVASKKLAMDQGLNLLITELGTVTDLDSPQMSTISSVVGIYARTVATLAFKGKLPGSTETLSSEDPLRQAAQTLVQQVLDADCLAIKDAIHTLARTTQSYLAKWKLRKRPGEKTGEEIYAMAANERYPSPSICTELWAHSYDVFNATASPSELAQTTSLFLKPLTACILMGEPAIPVHVLPTPRNESQSYAPYKQRVKACVTAISRPMRAMRGSLPSLLTDLTDADVSAGQANLQELCVRLAPDLIVLNLSPVSEIHNAAQNVVRAAYTDAESRLDVFKALLSSTTGALVGIERALELFREACHHLVEANEAAKWIVRSGADILEALCGRTGGLLRSGAEHSYIDRKTEDLLVLQDLLPRIWELMCNSLAVIFQKTPKWAEHINREDMVAWFRDVSIFSTQLTEQVGTFTKAVNTKRRKERRAGQLASQDEEDAEDFIQSCFAEPLKEAIQWLRINDLEIVNETMSFIDKALEVFTGDVELPTHVKAAMLKFVEEQIKVESADQRKTLLSINELMDLQVRIAPESKRSSSENAIEISDSDDDASTSAKTPAKAMPSSQSWLASMGSPNKSSQGSSSKDAKQRKKMRQQKLNFQPADVIDVDALDSAASSSSRNSGAFAGQLKSSTSTGMQAWPKALQPTASSSSSSSSNKYKSASAAPSAGTSKKSSSSSLPKPNANMAALRQQHAATRTFAHMRPAQPRIPAANDMRQPVAPAASSSVTGADRTGKPSVPTPASSDSDSDSGSDEGEDEDGQPKGLAALEQARTSPGKKHARAIMAKVKPQQPARRTQLMGENDIEKARKERQEAERKRLLRAATDLRNLHFSILEWDWYHQGDTYPPSRGNTLPPFHPVADKFRNADEYGATFGPLLMLECWMQLQQAKEQYERGEVSTYPCEVQGRVSVDQFVDVSVVMTTQTPASFRVGESDVVIMRQREDGLAPDQRASKPRILIAKVEMFKRSPKGSQLTLRCVLEGDTQGISSHLVNRSIWDIGSLFTLSTVNREFGALLTLPHYDLVRDVMQAKVAPRYRATREEVNKMVQTYGTNEPQAEAILGALQSQGFSLVQGPPGTGKTKTICALVAHFVATRRTPQPISTAGTRGPVKPAVTAKLLMCAPSNAAIDEVARRAKAGMRGPDGKDIKPKVVRIGRDDAMNVAVKDISLDNLVEQAMAKSAGQLGDGTSVDQLEAEMRAIRHEKDVKQSELDQLRLAGASDSVTAARLKHIEMEIRNLVSRRMAVAQRLDEARDKRQTGMRQMDADRRRIRNEILLDADVICSTLSGAGHEGLATLPIDFETVIIDEAAQAIELSTLIPLRYGCKRCILVGDPKQLPPTVISPKAERLRYSQSLFKRMYDQAQQDVYLLSIQYRMHPDISLHPSAAFYGGALRDGPHMDQLTARPWHRDDLLAPFRFFSIKGQERQTRGHSFVNPDEAHAALALYERLVRSSPDFDFDGKVGLVTGYKAQMIELKRVFQQRYGSDIGDRVDFNTVDGFQGQEKDVIIFSLVRSGRTGLGFLEDERRINVAVTRAKSSLFILGNAEGLREASRREGLWRMLVDEAEKRGALRVGNKSTFQQTAIGGGRAGGSDQQRKGGRARPAGWLAVEASAAAGREGSTSGGSSTAVSSRTASPSPAKKAKLDAGESSARPAAAAAAPPRPPLPAGLQTMRPGANGGMTSTSVRGPGSTPAAPPRARPTPPSVNGGSSGSSGSNALPAGLQTRRPPAPAAAAAPPRPAAPVNGNGGGGGGGGTRVVRAGNSGANPNGAGQPTFRPARPPPRPAQNPQRPPGRPLPPPGSGANGGGPRPPRPPGPSAPSQAAMDAMFVKKRKR